MGDKKNAGITITRDHVRLAKEIKYELRNCDIVSQYGGCDDPNFASLR